MNYEIRILHFEPLGFMAKVKNCSKSGNVDNNGPELYHGEYHPTPEAALERAMEHLAKRGIADQNTLTHQENLDRTLDETLDQINGKLRDRIGVLMGREDSLRATIADLESKLEKLEAAFDAQSTELETAVQVLEETHHDCAMEYRYRQYPTIYTRPIGFTVPSISYLKLRLELAGDGTPILPGNTLTRERDEAFAAILDLEKRLAEADAHLENAVRVAAEHAGDMGSRLAAQAEELRVLRDENLANAEFAVSQTEHCSELMMKNAAQAAQIERLKHGIKELHECVSHDSWRCGYYPECHCGLWEVEDSLGLERTICGWERKDNGNDAALEEKP